MQAENLTNNEHNQRVKGDSNSGCFVLTAVYGSPYFPIVMEFRRFRDDYLLTNILGRVSIKYYYRFGPYWAGKVQKHPVSKIFLAPFFKFVSLFLPKSKDNFRNNIY